MTSNLGQQKQGKKAFAQSAAESFKAKYKDFVVTEVNIANAKEVCGKGKLNQS